MTTSALKVEKATKNFPGVKALDSVSLDLQPGEIHALLGENGAGKSTLIKIITGVYRPEEGEIRIAGKQVNFTSPQQALSAGIGTVHQERNLIPHYSIAENIMPFRGLYIAKEPFSFACQKSACLCLCFLQW